MKSIDSGDFVTISDALTNDTWWTEGKVYEVFRDPCTDELCVHDDDRDIRYIDDIDGRFTKVGYLGKEFETVPELEVGLEEDVLTIKSVETNGDAMKFDGGKPKAGTLYEYFPNAINEINKVSTFGCNKYERGSFIDVPNGYERYNDAFHRHLIQEQSGEVYDEESNLLHAAHAAWGALCRLEFILRDKQNAE